MGKVASAVDCFDVGAGGSLEYAQAESAYGGVYVVEDVGLHALEGFPFGGVGEEI